MLNPSPRDHIGIGEHACGMRGSGEGGGSGGVDTSSEHADGYAAERNVPHTGIEPRHVETARWIRQGWGERNDHLIVLGPEVGRPQVYAYSIKRPPCVVNVSRLQEPALHREKEKRRMPLAKCQERVLRNITGLAGASCTPSFPSSCRGVQIYQAAGTEAILKDKRDRSIGSVANHRQTHLASIRILYCLIPSCLPSAPVISGISRALQKARLRSFHVQFELEWRRIDSWRQSPPNSDSD
jgi:hypothetical protein